MGLCWQMVRRTLVGPIFGNLWKSLGIRGEIVSTEICLILSLFELDSKQLTVGPVLDLYWQVIRWKLVEPILAENAQLLTAGTLFGIFRTDKNGYFLLKM